MKACFFIILLSHALVGWLAIEGVLALIFRYFLPTKQANLRQGLLNKALEGIDSENVLAQKIEALDLEMEVAPVLDQRLEDLVEQFRSQIPMGGMFLAGSVVERFKAKAKLEILKALPAIKANFVKKVEREFDLRQLIEEKIQALDFNQLGQSLYQTYRADVFKLRACGALMGLGIGLLVLAVLVWVC